jgi:hypothetical protein
MTPFIEGIRTQALTVVSPIYVNGQLIPLHIKGIQSVKVFMSELTHMQTQLRTLKRQVNAEMKVLKLNYANKRSNASSHPFLSLLAGRKKGIHQTALDRQRMRQAEHNALVPYTQCLTMLDSFITMIDAVKLDAKRQIAQQQS